MSSKAPNTTPKATTTSRKAATASTRRKSTKENFEEWKKNNKKTYASKSEEEAAAKKYAANEKQINEHNRRKNVTYQQGTNENSDMSYEEKKSKIMGAKKPEAGTGRGKRSVARMRRSNDAAMSTTTFEPTLDFSETPASLDYRWVNDRKFNDEN
jgi:phage-related minor tail protein